MEKYLRKKVTLPLHFRRYLQNVCGKSKSSSNKCFQCSWPYHEASIVKNSVKYVDREKESRHRGGRRKMEEKWWEMLRDPSVKPYSSYGGGTLSFEYGGGTLEFKERYWYDLMCILK